MVMKPKFHPVKLIGLNDRVQKILSYYHGCMYLQEYNEFGKPLNIYEGKMAIFCVSPDHFWNGWFILDEDVRFTQEYEHLIGVLKDVGLVKED